VASAPGGIGLPQLVHVAIDIVAVLSVTVTISGDGSVIARLTYIFYVWLSQIYY
jgi:hypothetical protein